MQFLNLSLFSSISRYNVVFAYNAANGASLPTEGHFDPNLSAENHKFKNKHVPLRTIFGQPRPAVSLSRYLMGRRVLYFIILDKFPKLQVIHNFTKSSL